jgi:hypothetical protein
VSDNKRILEVIKHESDAGYSLGKRHERERIIALLKDMWRKSPSSGMSNAIEAISGQPFLGHDDALIKGEEA